MRRSLLFIHRWTGLVLALYAIVIGLTGSILVFRDELAPVLRPRFHAGAEVAVLTTPDDVLAAAQRALPGWRQLSVTWPHAHSPHFNVFSLKDRESRIVYLSARDAKVVGILDPRSDFLGIIDGLHGNLLGARPGRVANGLGGIFTMLLCLTGIFLWWTNRRQWPSWFRLSGRRSWWRVPWDLHHLIGFTALPLLFVIAFTGIYFTWNSVYIGAVAAVFPRFVEPSLPATPQILLPAPATLADVASSAQRALPGPRILRVAVVPQRDRPINVTLRDGEAGEFHLSSTVYLDPRDASVLKIKRLAERPVGDTIIGWFSAVHFGIFGGLAVKLLWFLIGLAYSALAFTGALMWWRGLRRYNMGR